MGGLLGLFMGFSVFSIVEVLYFLSIRPYCSYMRSAKQRREALQRVFRRFDHIKIRGITKTEAKLNANAHSSSENSIMNNAIFPHVN